MEERNERGPLPPQVDPKWSQDAQSTKTDDSRLGFYAMYKNEATKYDKDFAKRNHEELNSILIVAGLLSAICAAFAVDIRSGLSDPSDQTEALLSMILFTLDPSALSGQDPDVPFVLDTPPGLVFVTTWLIYASLLTSVYTASIALIIKHRLSNYLVDEAGPVSERCGDRQRRRDKLEGEKRHDSFSTLHALLQVAFLLLGLGVYFYIVQANVVLGVALALWLGFGLPLILLLFKTAPQIPLALKHLILYFWNSLLQIKIPYHLRRLSLPITQLPPQESTPRLAPLSSLREDIRSEIPHLASHSPQPIPLSTIPDVPPNPPVTSQWLLSAAMREANANDVRCVSWILRRISNQESFDTASLRAGTVRWFEDELKKMPPFDILVSILKACFSSTGKIYPGMRDSAYCSLRAIVWIHIRATRVSEELARSFALPDIHYSATSLDPDLKDLLGILSCQDTRDILPRLYFAVPGVTPAHLRWTSRALLHLSLVEGDEPREFGAICDYKDRTDQNTFPPDAILDRLLASCIFLGHPIEKAVLEVEDKSDDVEKILSRLSRAIVPAISTSHPQRNLLPYVLRDLIWCRNRPSCLTEMVYEWCSAVFKNYPNLADGQDDLADGRDLLLLFLQIGFRHLDPQCDWIEAKPDHTNHHQQMATIVFASGDSEAIGDLLQAWMPGDESHQLYTSLGMCAEPLVGLRRLRPFSSRLRQLAIRAVGLIGYQEFEQVGVEEFVELLSDLDVSVEDTIDRARWIRLLLDTVQSSEGIRRLPYSYWELLAELTSLGPWELEDSAYDPRLMTYLDDAGEWEKLGCWVGVVWMAWPPGDDVPTEGDLERATLSLSRQRPDAIQKLEQWMEQRGDRSQPTPESFQRICGQARRDSTRQSSPQVPALQSPGMF